LALLAGREDGDLVARIKRHDSEAIALLFDRYGPLAYSLILRIVPEPSLAEDILAETFVKAWNRIAALPEGHSGNLGLWFLLLARNHAVESLRPSGNWLSPGAPARPLPELPALAYPFPGRREAEHLHFLHSAFISLEEYERQALEAFCFDGLSQSELALKLNQPVAEVRKRASSALAKLVAPVTNT
jgi:RNA polymerase sigma-70 factor (ECF subfamily)